MAEKEIPLQVPGDPARFANDELIPPGTTVDQHYELDTLRTTGDDELGKSESSKKTEGKDTKAETQTNPRVASMQEAGNAALTADEERAKFLADQAAAGAAPTTPPAGIQEPTADVDTAPNQPAGTTTPDNEDRATSKTTSTKRSTSSRSRTSKAKK